MIEGKPKYYELVDAVVGMACQYLEQNDKQLYSPYGSAGEAAIEVLTQLGLIKDNKIINEAYNNDYLKSKYDINA